MGLTKMEPVLYLHQHATRRLPEGSGGALVLGASASRDSPVRIAWRTRGAPLLPGQMSLLWEPGADSGWDVQAHLGLAKDSVLLASWPSVPDHWPEIVRPTLCEVRGLFSAFRLTKKALTLALS